ncbi:MAG: GAP family protein [Pseudomonadota bacterium]|nr:GAP family protein [Pseudomonadota bacterium]
MLADAIGKMLPAVMAIALTPIQIVAAVVVLGGPQGRAGGFAFLTGWLVALGALVTVAILLVDKLGESGRTPTPLLHWLQLAAGLLLLSMAIRLWRRRTKNGEEPVTPKWLASLGEARPVQAFMAGASTAAANPKIVALVLSSATSIAYLALSAWQLVAVAVLFVLLGSTPLITLVVAHATGGLATASRIRDLKGFMLRHNDVILTVVLAMLGVSVLGNGISGLR